MKLTYTAGPYNAPTLYGIVCNIKNAEDVAVDLWRMGYAVICPHKNTAMMDGTLDKDDREMWLEGDFEMIRRCDCIVMIPGWEKSEGAKAERKLAKELNIPVFYYPRDVVEMAMFADTTSTVR